MNATKNHIGKHKTTRRTQTKTTAPTVGRIYGMDETGERHFRNPKRPKEICSDKPTSNGFLKTIFLPKLKENEFQKPTSKAKQNLTQIQRKNTKTETDFYQSLFQLAEHYGLSPMPTKEFEYPYNMALSIWDIKKQLQDKIENYEHIHLMQKGSETYFISEERCNTGSNLFYIPVIPLYKMLKDQKKKKTAQLLLSVCSYLYRNVNIPYYRQENSYLYWMYEMLTDWIDQDEEMDENHSCKKELQEVEIIGNVMEQKISHRKNLEIFRKRFNQFKPKDDFDEECFRLASKTIQMYSDYPEESIFRNAHFNNIQKQENTDEEEFYNEEKIISMDKYISFCADDKGLIYDNLIENVNSEFNEYAGMQEPMITKTFDGNEITDKTLDFENKLFEVLRELATVLGTYSRMNN